MDSKGNIETLISKIGEQAKYIVRLEKANEHKTKWLSLLSHEFKGFLGNVLWITNAAADHTIPGETLLDNLIPELSIQAAENVALLQEAFDWFRIKKTDVSPVMDEIKCIELFNTLSVHFETALKVKDLRFRYSGPDGMAFLGDTFLLNIILKKIMDNAVKYSFPDNEIVMDSCLTTEKDIQITISDNGTGMEYKTPEQLFSLNRQTNLGTCNEKGAGIGLFLARDYLEMMDGRMFIVSELNKGTTVKIVLPNKKSV